MDKISHTTSVPKNKFQVYVAFVDQNSTIRDEQVAGVLETVSPQTGRNLHVGGYKLFGTYHSPVLLNILVPVELMGDFKVPQRGDLIWVEESYRDRGEAPIYLYSSYNSIPLSDKIGASPVPQWGSLEGDYGHIRTYRDHVRQFSTKVATRNFTTKYIRSITGWRWRSFYRGNLKKGRFALRGDPVFDIDPQLINSKVIVESGTHIGVGGALVSDKGRYPNPLNAPTSRDTDDDYRYVVTHYSTIDEPLNTDHYKSDHPPPVFTPKREEIKLKTKNYFSYQPIVDKDYLARVSFERELPAAEEVTFALRGNNKLTIQDQYGDGEQLLITLKNQYDAGISIIHNQELGQVRIRDYMGQGILLEADRENPRVVLWTADRQKIEAGRAGNAGTFVYIRNGAGYGDSETEFGTKTGTSMGSIPNQEYLMVNSPSVASEIASRISSGLASLAGGKGAGIFMRNTDTNQSTQNAELYAAGNRLVHRTEQIHEGHRTVFHSEVAQPLATHIIQTFLANQLENSIVMEPGSVTATQFDVTEPALSRLRLTRTAANVTRILSTNIVHDVVVDDAGVHVRAPSGSINLTSPTVMVTSPSVTFRRTE